MKILYQNIRGIANSPSKLVLKRLILANKPDFVFNIFTQNLRENLLPNLWCFCLHSINPNILDIDNQQIAFSINVNNKTFVFPLFMPPTVTLLEKTNGISLTSSNPIRGAHEHSGYLSLARPSMLDFQNWLDTFDLLHLPTRGAAFTWENGRTGRRHIKRRLDRTVCN